MKPTTKTLIAIAVILMISSADIIAATTRIRDPSKTKPISPHPKAEFSEPIRPLGLDEDFGENSRTLSQNELVQGLVFKGPFSGDSGPEPELSESEDEDQDVIDESNITPLQRRLLAGMRKSAQESKRNNERYQDYWSHQRRITDDERNYYWTEEWITKELKTFGNEALKTYYKDFYKPFFDNKRKDLEMKDVELREVELTEEMKAEEET